MPYRVFKRINQAIAFIFLLSCSFITYAQPINCDIHSDDAPTLDQIVCPLARVINIAILAVGSVLVIMVVVGAMKMALALGDPKGLKGALITWQYVAVGGAIVIGVFAILFILTNLFGINFSPMNLTNALAEYIRNLLVSFGIGGTWSPP